MELTETARFWNKKWSTWLTVTLGTAIVTFSLLPERIQEAIPAGVLAAIGLAVMFVVPAAIQVKQKSIQKALREFRDASLDALDRGT